MTVALTIPGADFDDETLPQRGFDELLTGGTIHMFDFGNPACYPAQSNPITSGITDLSPHARPGTRFGGTSALLFAGGGLEIGTVAGYEGFYFADAAYDLSAVQDHEYLISLWFKPTAAGDASFSPQWYGVGDRSGNRNATDNFFHIIGNGSLAFNNAGSVVTAFGFDVGAVQQIAYHIVSDENAATTLIHVYKDGEKRLTVPTTWRDWGVPVAPAVQIGIEAGNNWVGINGRVYRGFIEDVTVSQIEPDYWIARDYELNSGRFT